MLSVLHIENIAVIEQAEILFEGGFNVLTGETGAGKSIVIDAISAILGERTYRDVIRTGANRAFVSAIFTNIPQYDWFSENQVEFDTQELQVQREIYADGRNVCRVNGRPVSVASLKKLGGRLINIHGQHDSQQLFDEENHLTYLDAFARDEQELEAYQQAFSAMQSVQREIQKLSMDESEKLRLVETLTFQIEEIRAANLVSGEEEQLKERRKVLQNAEKLSDALRMADEALYGGDSSDGAAGLLSNAEHALSRVSTISADMQTLHQKISDLMYSVQDAADELRAMRDDLSYSEGELEEIEERLDAIHKLKRKYGASVEDVLAYLADSEQRLDEIEFASDRIETLKKREAELQKETIRQGEILREKRLSAAQAMESRICDELRQLDMPKIRFVCEFTPQQPMQTGLDSVRFLMSANVGENLKPLSKVASGGELARIMLAMKQVLAQQDGVPTLIFDEVDAGVSGRAAQKVAYKLWTVSKGRQVLCVTHLPQIAAMADAEYTVEKRVENERTYTSVLHLDESGRKQELARLIGGSMITETTLAGAAELLRLAEEAKSETNG
ncbi:MAG: DNA repair protein RecN [Clostridiales bacterium]|mgnify:FL=1|nr:DNA repair protein RecN [Clostridiales bacterium]MDD6064050.1 DNA repair protein RecN [Clostridiales bacterium]